jgi:hypothetical protein
LSTKLGFLSCEGIADIQAAAQIIPIRAKKAAARIELLDSCATQQKNSLNETTHYRNAHENMGLSP